MKQGIDGESVRRWIAPNIDVASGEGLLLAWPGAVRALTQDGRLVRFPEGPVAAALTENSFHLASAGTVQSIEWFRVRGWTIEGGRLLLSWLSSPLLDHLDSLDFELSSDLPRKLRRQFQETFLPLITRLVELARGACTAPQIALVDGAADLIHRRIAMQISATDADVELGKLFAAAGN
jgi:hypothetical protein